MENVLVTGSTGIGGAVAAALRGRAVTVGRDGDVRADLSLLGETARAAAEAPARLDAVVCCAGNFSLRAETTAEGLERSFVLNYLSRFLLVRLLLPRLVPGGRVVLVAAAGRYRDTLGDVRALRGGRGLRISGRTQFTNDLFAAELATRHPGPAVGCVYPGLVATRVFRDAYGVPAPLRRVLDRVQQRFGADPAAAAATPVALATGPRLPSGFYGPGCRRLPIPARVSAGRRAEVWAASEDLVRPWLNAPVR
nr:hypothetical protein [uncultured Actinoplanes sp.]